MVVLEEAMEVDTSSSNKKRKSANYDTELFAHGKRVKFVSYEKAAKSKTVSAASATLIQDEEVEKVGHFKKRLDHWTGQELNITEGFSAFTKTIYKLSYNLAFVLLNKDVLAETLIEHITEGDQLFLEPLYDLAAHFAIDIQGKNFWPYFGKMVQAFGTSFPKIKGSDGDNSEPVRIIRSGYVALTTIIRMMMRYVDQNEEIKSLEVLQLSLNGITRDTKGLLPSEQHALCGSALGQIIRRSKTQDECVKFLLEKCDKKVDLASHVLIWALKTTDETYHKDSDKIWEVIVDTIGVVNSTPIWNHLINITAAKAEYLRIYDFMKILFVNWTEKVDELDSDGMACKFDVLIKVLELCRGKLMKIKSTEQRKKQPKIEEVLTKLICAMVKNYSSRKDEPSHEKFIANLTLCVSKLCSSPTEDAVTCVEAFVGSDINVEEKITILGALTKCDHFESFFSSKMVRILMKHGNKDEALSLAEAVFGDFVHHKLTSDKWSLECHPIIEFPCDNPKDPKTFPHQMLKRLQKKQNQLDNNNLLYCLLSFRPLLEMEKATEVLFKLMEENISEINLERLYLVVRCLSDLVMCPKEFLEKFDSGSDKLLPKLGQWMDNTWACQILALVLSKAEVGSTHNWLQRNVLGPLHGQEIVEELHNNLCQNSPELRQWILICLTKLFPKTDVYQIMLQVETSEVTIHTYRDRVKYMNSLNWDSQAVQKIHENAQVKLGVFRFLLSQFSVNFKLLWEPTLKVIETYVSGSQNAQDLWTTWLKIFEKVNLDAGKRCEPEDTEMSVNLLGIYNFRNQLLNVLSTCEPLTRMAEKNNVIVCRLFLDVFIKCETKSKDGKGLHAFLTLFGKFYDLKSISRFGEVKNIAEHCLGHYNTNNRVAAVGFFLAAHKVLRQHKEILNDLVDSKKWKGALLGLPDDIAKTDNQTVKAMLFYILGAKFKQTVREKRKAQIANRKFLVRVIFQVLGQDQALEFLHQFVQKEAPFLRSNTEENEYKEMVKKMAMIYDILIISAQSAGGVSNVFRDILDVLECEGKLLQAEQLKQPLLLSKERSLMLQHLLSAYETFKDCQWTEEDHYKILEMCVLPLLNPKLSEEKSNKQRQYMAKTANLFQCWINNYVPLFFQKVENKNVALWICESVLQSEAVESVYKEKILNVTCSLVLKIFEFEIEEVYDSLKSDILPVLGQSLREWLNRGKIKIDKESAKKLKALTFTAKSECLSPDLVDYFAKKLHDLAPKWKGQVQNEALNVLHSISNLTNFQANLKSFQLISSIQGRDGRNVAGQLLWKNMDNPLKVRLNDNLIMNEEYKKLFDASVSGGSFNIKNFLWCYHFASSEIVLSENEFAERNAAGMCVRDLIRRAKDRLSAEQFHEVADSDILPVISKGLMAKHDRVQGEFIQILTEAITDDGRLGSLQGLLELQSDDKIEDETNFFDNMRHIQKHRRGRAMRRVTKNIDTIDVEIASRIILPLARTYLYNPDYVQFNEIIASAIDCIGAISSKLPWKSYSKLLQQFLSQKPLEPPFQKQRVKVLACILDSFHFSDQSTMTKAKAMLERLLRKKSTTGHTFFKDGVEETQAGDLTLYVPIMKILMLLPEEELNHHVSTLIVKVASQLRSRKLEERQLARGILSEMAVTLGPSYLPHVVSILKAQLQRGYQVHILVYTTHTVLSSVINKCNPHEAIDVVVNPILEMVNNELFATLNEEKKVSALVKKTAEAKKVVSYHMLELLALHISKTMVGPMLTQLLNFVKGSSSFESGQKISKAGKSILEGLLKNQNFTRSDLISLGYGLLAGKLCEGHSSKPKMIDELGFALLHAAANPGCNDSPLTAEDIKPFLAFMQQGLQSKDVGTCTACLKFIVAVTTGGSGSQQLKFLVNSMMAFTDFMELVWKRCQLYVRMRSQPYSLACQALKNLISHASTYQFTTERIKTMCLFFKGSLEETNDDKSAMQLIGLILLKYYRSEVLEPYLKLLCSSGLRSDDEGFKISKKILWRIIQRHMVCFKPAMAFYAVNIDIEDERARWRSIQMCQELHQDFVLQSKQKEAKFDAKGLFVHAVLTFYNEESKRCKKALEDLIKVIGREFAQKRAIESEIHHLVVDWLEAKDPVHVGLACKIMSLLIQDPVQVKTTLDVAFKRLTQKNFLQRPLQLIDEDEVNLQYAVAITYGLQLLRNLVLEANKEALVKASVPMHKLTGLLLHTCVDVRMEAVSLVNLLISEADFDHLESWLSGEDLRKILDNLCEIARSEPPETEEFVQCLSNLALLVLKSSSEASEKFTKTILKKTRGFFTHEKINLHAKEWTRRQVYYRFVSQVLKGLNKGQTTTSIEAFVNTMKKNVLKDRKQAELEAQTSEVQEWCEKWMRN